MSKRIRLLSKLLPGLLFPLAIFALGMYVFISSFYKKFVTAAFAGGFGGILVGLSAVLILRDIRRSLAESGPRPDSVPGERDQQTPSLIVPLAWCVGFVVIMLFIGLLWAIPVWVFVFLVVHRARWVFTIVTPLLLWTIMKFGVESGLETIFFKGILFGDKPPVFW